MENRILNHDDGVALNDGLVNIETMKTAMDVPKMKFEDAMRFGRARLKKGTVLIALRQLYYGLGLRCVGTHFDY